MRSLIAVVLGLLVTHAAQAQFWYSGPYVGLALGALELEDDASQTGIGLSDTRRGYRLFGGYHIHETLAVELGVAKSESFHEGFNLFDPVLGAFAIDLGAEYEAATLRAVGVAPWNSIDIFGGIGFFDADVTLSGRLTGPDGVVDEAIVEETASGATIIGGMQFHFDRFLLRGEYEWFDDDRGITAASFNIALVFRFNR